MGIQIIPVTVNHLKAFASLSVMPDHTAPDDRLIISQAISDHRPLISFDRKFALYRKEGWTSALTRDSKSNRYNLHRECK